MAESGKKPFIDSWAKPAKQQAERPQTTGAADGPETIRRSTAAEGPETIRRPTAADGPETIRRPTAAEPAPRLRPVNRGASGPSKGRRLWLVAGAAVLVAGGLVWALAGGDGEPGSPPASEPVSECATTAEQCWRSAAEGGDPAAQFKLAMAYATGDKAARDPVEASRWYSKAIEGGYPDAQYYMGEIYFYGQGVERSLELAESWFSKAAAAKDKLQEIAKERGQPE